MMSRPPHAWFRLGALALALGAAGCAASGPTRSSAGPSVRLADPEATPETRALFVNLRRLAPEAVLYGHHDDLAYGYTWRGEPGRSDTRDVAGSYPAVYSWDVTRLFERGQLDRPSAEGAAELREWILASYARGGVSTLCWHMQNPVTRTHSWDTTRAVGAILPGGERHALYTQSLDVLADFLKSLRVEGSGELVPIVFRPFHEHTGDWFWWGRAHSTVEEFTGLWRFTVEYLRDEKDVHNLLYAYSTDVFDSEAAYLERYPGDDVIDVLGYDDYHSIRTVATRDTFVARLRTLGRLAEARGKIAALTETGVETVPDPTWWTNVLLPALTADEWTRRIAWVVTWRNANPDGDRADHFYAPYPGHPSAPDFVRFYRDPYVLFEDELPDLYALPEAGGAP